MPVKEWIGGERKGDFTDYYISCPAKTLTARLYVTKGNTQYEE
jgi:hypothetical protein